MEQTSKKTRKQMCSGQETASCRVQWLRASPSWRRVVSACDLDLAVTDLEVLSAASLTRARLHSRKLLLQNSSYRRVSYLRCRRVGFFSLINLAPKNGYFLSQPQRVVLCCLFICGCFMDLVDIPASIPMCFC